MVFNINFFWLIKCSKTLIGTISFDNQMYLSQTLKFIQDTNWPSSNEAQVTGMRKYSPKNVNICWLFCTKPVINLKIFTWKSSSNIPSTNCHPTVNKCHYKNLVRKKIVIPIDSVGRSPSNLTSFVFMYCARRVSDFPLLCRNWYPLEGVSAWMEIKTKDDSYQMTKSLKY